LFVIINPLPPDLLKMPGGAAETAAVPQPPGLTRYPRIQLSAILTHRALITHHYDPLSSVDEVRAYAERHEDCARRGPDYLFHLVLDRIVDDYTPVVERISDQLDQLETRMFRKPTPDVLARLMKLKRRVTYLRKTLILEREVLARLVRGEFELVDPREI